MSMNNTFLYEMSFWMKLIQLLSYMIDQICVYE